MRIIGGQFKGRRFQAPKRIPARPTTDYARESLFNILSGMVEWNEVQMLDLFAGIGTISLEAVSRGVKELTCVDANFHATKWIKDALKTLEVSQAHVIRSKAEPFLERCQSTFDLIFADPPYDYTHYPELIESSLKCLAMNEGLFILEHRRDKSFEEHPNFAQERTYGEVRFTFFKPL